MEMVVVMFPVYFMMSDDEVLHLVLFTTNTDDDLRLLEHTGGVLISLLAEFWNTIEYFGVFWFFHKSNFDGGLRHFAFCSAKEVLRQKHGSTGCSLES